MIYCIFKVMYTGNIGGQERVTYHIMNENGISSHLLPMQQDDVINNVSVSMVVEDCIGPAAISSGTCVFGNFFAVQ